MRGVTLTLCATGALAVALFAGPAAAGCYGDCYDDGDPGYRSAPPATYYRSGPPTYYRSAPPAREYYDDRRVYGDRRVYDDRSYYDDRRYDPPGYHTTYYRRYDESYYDRPSSYYRSYSTYDRPYYYNRYHRHYYPTVRYGGAWQQNGYPNYAYYGGCHSAYIPYGWTWYRARSC